MYTIYKYYDAKNKSSYYTNHLNILRQDKTENELFEHRFIDTDYKIERKRPYNSPLKKLDLFQMILEKHDPVDNLV